MSRLYRGRPVEPAIEVIPNHLSGMRDQGWSTAVLATRLARRATAYCAGNRLDRVAAAAGAVQTLARGRTLSDEAYPGVSLAPER
jgi:hypothetical protein